MEGRQEEREEEQRSPGVTVKTNTPHPHQPFFWNWLTDANYLNSTIFIENKKKFKFGCITIAVLNLKKHTFVAANCSNDLKPLAACSSSQIPLYADDAVIYCRLLTLSQYSPNLTFFKISGHLLLGQTTNCSDPPSSADGSTLEFLSTSRKRNFSPLSWAHRAHPSPSSFSFCHSVINVCRHDN